MAQSTLHFAVGMGIGTLFAARPWLRAWRMREPMAEPFARWIVLACAGGIYATVPSLMRGLGFPEWVVSGWWMNIFALHPLMDQLRPGGILIGEVAVAGCFAAQYLLMLVAIRRASAAGVKQGCQPIEGSLDDA